MRNLSLAGVLLAATLLLSGLPATAQDDPPMAIADTSSPRATLRSFIDASNEVYGIIRTEYVFDRTNPAHSAAARRQLDCLDVSNLPAFARDDRAREVAVCLKEILDRVQIPDWDEIPDIEAIEAAGGFEKLSRWRIPGTRLTIARVEEGTQKHEYLFSPGTVDRAIEYYRSLETRPYRTTGPATSPKMYRWYMSVPGDPWVASVVRRLPERLKFGRTLGMTNWKWPGLLLSALLAVGAMVLLYGVGMRLGRWARGTRPLAYVLTVVFPVAAMCVPKLFEHFVYSFLTVRGTPLYVLGFVVNAVFTLAAIVVVFASFSRIAELIIASPRIRPQGLNAQLIRITCRLLSLLVAAIVFVVGGQYVGIPVGTLLASAGIGGIALALGAQDTLKTLFGTVMLMADKPFQVGDRIVFRNYDGVVEDIGLRSTRLRLLSSHQVTVPNDELARSDIENIGRRGCIRRVTDVHIPLDTPREKVERAVAILREELDGHEGMDPEFPPRVFFLDFLPTAFAIRVIYWYHPPNYWDYLAFGERFNLAVFRRFEEEGIRFVLPQRLTHTSVESRPAALEVQVQAEAPTDERPAGLAAAGE